MKSRKNAAKAQVSCPLFIGHVADESTAIRKVSFTGSTRVGTLACYPLISYVELTQGSQDTCRVFCLHIEEVSATPCRGVIIEIVLGYQSRLEET